MNLRRWLRFNLVGVLGFAVQLGSLAVLHRAFPHHNLYCSVAALEITLLHNFVWHRRFTWRAPAAAPVAAPVAALACLSQLLRFHAANGVVSLCGNVAGIWLLTRLVHLPLVAANAIAILGCSLVNFCLADRWTFRMQQCAPGPAQSAPGAPQAARSTA